MEAVFSLERPLLPHPTDLSFLNWHTHTVAGTATANFEVSSVPLTLLTALSSTWQESFKTSSNASSVFMVPSIAGHWPTLNPTTSTLSQFCMT